MADNIERRKGSPFWYCRVQVNGRLVRRSTGQTKKSEAEKVARRMIAEARGEAILDEVFSKVLAMVEEMPEAEQTAKRQELSARLLRDMHDKVSLADVWAIWLGSPKRNGGQKRKTLTGYESKWNAFVRWLGEHHHEVLYLHEISDKITDQYARFLDTKGYSGDTFNQHIKLLRNVCKTLAKDAGMEGDPWQDIVRKPLNTEGKRPLTKAEVGALLSAADGDEYAMVAVGLYTGLRFVDVCKLRWADLHGEGDDQVIDCMPIKTVRTNKRITVPLNDDLRELLAKRRHALPDDAEYVFPDAATLYDKDDGVTIGKRFTRLFQKAGIKTQAKAEKSNRKRNVSKVGFHSLRHTFVSLCGAENVPQITLQELVGHGSPEMTRVYSHADDQQKRRAVRSLPDLKVLEAEAKKGGEELSPTEEAAG